MKLYLWTHQISVGLVFPSNVTVATCVNILRAIAPIYCWKFVREIDTTRMQFYSVQWIFNTQIGPNSIFHPKSVKDPCMCLNMASFVHFYRAFDLVNLLIANCIRTIRSSALQKVIKIQFIFYSRNNRKADDSISLLDFDGIYASSVKIEPIRLDW